MTRTHMMILAAGTLSILMVHASAMAAGSRQAARTAATETACSCDDDSHDTSKCQSRVTNADGEDGKDNASADSGNGGKGGTIKNADKCSKASANGGKGGSGNRGAKSGNGGKGGNISF